VRDSVYQHTFNLSQDLNIQAYDATSSISILESSFSKSAISNGGTDSIRDTLTKAQNLVQSINIREAICGESSGLSVFSVFSKFSLNSESSFTKFLNGENSVMPKASSIFSGNFKLDKKSFKTTENIGRPDSLAKKRKDDPFEYKEKSKPDSMKKTEEEITPPPSESSSPSQLLAFLKSFNGLKTRDSSSCKYEDVEQLDETSQLYINSTTKKLFLPDDLLHFKYDIARCIAPISTGFAHVPRQNTVLAEYARLSSPHQTGQCHFRECRDNSQVLWLSICPRKVCNRIVSH
jgi:hypothetical protein